VRIEFPFQTYPSYAYFKYFHECKLGPDGYRAKASIKFSSLFCAIALISAIVTLMQIRDKDLPCTGRGGSNDVMIMASFPVKTGSEETRNNKKKSNQMEKRVATASMEYDEEELSFDAPSNVLSLLVVLFFQ
jgi:hypothetical protein